MKTEVIRLYEDRTDVTLTTYIIDDSLELLSGKAHPAILICPGGGYFNCSDREAEPIALKFAAMGYHAFVLRYSTYCGDGAFPDLSKSLPVKESSLYPNAMREIGKAFLLIHEHAGEWMVDVDRIAVCGFSAGGHNAAMYATHWQEEVITGYFKEDAAKFRPAAAILGYPLTDYVFKEKIEATRPKMDQIFFRGSDVAFLGTEQPSKELLEEVSPALHVTKHMPPTYLWATASDELVPVQHSIRMAHALADANIPFELHIFEEGPHGLSLANQASAGAKTQISQDAAKWADLAGIWLEKRFALPLLEKTAFEEAMEKGAFPVGK